MQMRKFIFTAAMVMSTASGVVVASEPTPNQIFDALTCSLSANTSSSDVLKYLEKSGRLKMGKDSLQFNESLSHEGTCIKRAEVVGSFGVVIVNAELCDSNFKALAQRFRSAFPESSRTTPDAGVIYRGQTKRGTVILYRGLMAAQPVPVASSPIVSFQCAIQESGPQ